MNWANILTIYLKELRDSLRDRRTVLSMIVVPTVVMPLLIFGFMKLATGVTAKAAKEVGNVMVIDAGNSSKIVAALETSDRLRMVPYTEDWKHQISEKKIRAAVKTPQSFDSGSATDDTVIMYGYDGELKSRLAVREIEKVLRNLRDDMVQTSLDERGLPASLVEPFKITWENVAPPEKVGGNKFGGLVPYLIIFLCFTGAMYPAMDLTAGEKERGTMETLLCSPVARVNIVLGKFLMVLTGSLSAVLLAMLSMGISFVVLGEQGSERPLPVIDPAGALGVLAIVLPVAVLFSALLFTASLFAKSFKEAQSYVTPLLFIVAMLTMVGILPGIELNAQLAWVPILNLSLVCKEMLSGVWHWNYIAIIFGSTCIYGGVALAVAVKMFKREDVIFKV